MAKNAYLWVIRLVTLVALGGLGLVIFYLDPAKIGLPSVAIGYLLIILFLTGMLSLFLFWLRRKSISGEADQGELLGVSMRQAVIISLAVAIGLILQQFRVLAWWNMLLIVSGAFLLELYFLTRG